MLTFTAANKLISELRAELAAQITLAKQGEQLRKDLESRDVNISGLHDTIEDLTGSLTEARKEIKTLSNKLAASRSTEVQIRAPGSAIKANTTANRSQAEALQAAQAKEDLYGDLTELIVRSYRRDESEKVFDCIQTGRNGSKSSHPWRSLD